MAYKLKPRETVDFGVRRIAVEQMDKTLGELDAGRDRDAVVHAVRKRCKKLRAMLRLVRHGLGAYAIENRALRDLSRSLARFRDGKVVLGTHDELVGHFGDVLDRGALGDVRRRLGGTQPDRSDAADAAELARRLDDFRTGLAAVRERVPGWVVDGEPHRVLGAGLVRTYKRGRRACRRAAASGAADDFHEWRKRVKYHWYHALLTAPLFADSIEWRAAEAERLSDLLGDAHDLAIYERNLDAIAPQCNATAIETLRALAVWRREQLQRRAVDAGSRLFAAKPGAFVAGLEAPRAAGSLRESA